MRQMGSLTIGSELGLKVVRAGERALAPADWPAHELKLAEIVKFGTPEKGLPEEVNEWRRQNAPNLFRGFRRVMAARALKIPTFYGTLFIRKVGADGSVVPYGLASLRVVTDVGVAFIVDAFQNLTELETMIYHGIGTGSTAEAAGDTALVTELTTQYNPDNTRATGSTTEGAGANIWRTVGTNTVDSAVGIQEHGMFNQAATGGGVLLDRSVFTVVNLGNGDSLETTYDLTLSAGS